MTTHLAVSIDGLADRLLGRIPKQYGSWEVLQNSKTGKLLAKEEVWEEIKRCKILGYEVIPTCDYVDERGFCKGHIDDEIAQK